MPVLTIYPYLRGNTWVFDDAATGLKEEPFVFGASEMIQRLVESKAIPKASDGFALDFDQEPFDHDVELRRQGDSGNDEPTSSPMGNVGTWYTGEVAGIAMTGWLCPALFLYFNRAPSKIYVKAGKLPEGIDPIWHIDRDDPAARRFMSAE